MRLGRALRTRAEVLAQLRSIRNDIAAFNKLPKSERKAVLLAYMRGGEKALKWCLEVPHSASRHGPKESKGS